MEIEADEGEPTAVSGRERENACERRERELGFRNEPEKTKMPL